MTTPEPPAVSPEATRAPPAVPGGPPPEHAPVAPSDPPVGATVEVAAPAGGEHPASRPRRRRMLRFAVTLLVALLVASNAGLWVSQRRASNDLDALRSATTARDARLTEGLRRLRDDLARVPDSPQGQQRVQDLVACVNQFIDTIGRWSTDVRSSFTYYFC